MRERDILAMYENAGALLKGHFVLSSGRHSGRYLQSALVLMQPTHAARLAHALATKVVADEVDIVVSPALGGLIIGYEMARVLNKPFLFTERQGGEMCLRRGFSLPDQANVLVVEDVMTTGGSVRECLQVVRAHGGNPRRVLSLVDRAPNQGQRLDVPFESLLQLDVPAFAADTCPLCQEGKIPAMKPGSRQERS
ncbi:MAG: orotate phosphoribosyltransferase [Mariprofundaceae bacterium]